MSSTPYSVDNVPQAVTNLVITHIRIVVHTKGAVLSQNYWSIYLIYTTGSLRINMQLADLRAATSEGQLTITSHGFTNVSILAIRSWDFLATSNLAIYYVIQVILDKGRWNYDMAEGGVGCRYWISTVIKDLVSQNYVAEKLVNSSSMKDIISYNYSLSQEPIYLEVERGNFLQTTGSGSKTTGSSWGPWGEWG